MHIWGEEYIYSLIDWLGSFVRLVNVLLSRALKKWDTGKNIQIERGMRVSMAMPRSA